MRDKADTGPPRSAELWKDSLEKAETRPTWRKAWSSKEERKTLGWSLGNEGTPRKRTGGEGRKMETEGWGPSVTRRLGWRGEKGRRPPVIQVLEVKVLEVCLTQITSGLRTRGLVSRPEPRRSFAPAVSSLRGPGSVVDCQCLASRPRGALMCHHCFRPSTQSKHCQMLSCPARCHCPLFVLHFPGLPLLVGVWVLMTPGRCQKRIQQLEFVLNAPAGSTAQITA